MSHWVKVLLLLVAMVYISAAQLHRSGNSCLCQDFRSNITRGSKDIQIYAASPFCDKVEFIITEQSGLRYCLSPDAKSAKIIVEKMKLNRSRRAAETTSSNV